MRKYFFPFLFTFLIVFNSFVPKIVYADAGTVVVATGGMIAGAEAIGTALSAVVPPVAIVALACVGAGVIFHNREEIKVFAGGIYQKMKVAGISIGHSASGALSLGADALAFINAQVTSSKSTQNITFDFPLSNTSTIYPTPSYFIGMVIASGTLYHWYDADGIMRTYDTNLQKTQIGKSIQLGIDSYSGAKVLNFGTNSYKVDVGRSVSFEYPLGSDGSICVDLPSTMTDTPSVSAPFPADTAIAIPADLTIGGTSVAGVPTDAWQDTLVGEKDWAVPFPLATDVPVDVPVDTPIGAIDKIIDWFTIDWDAVIAAMDFTAVWQSHFKPFYDITGALTNISSNPNDSGGKFYMVIPKAMGGDNQLHCVLDYTVAGIYVTWPRIFLGYAIWLAFGWWIIEQFKPKININ